jgi:hypothetical protein
MTMADAADGFGEGGTLDFSDISTEERSERPRMGLSFIIDAPGNLKLLPYLN